MQSARGSGGGHLTKAEGLVGYGCSSLEEELSNAMSRLGEGACRGVQGERPAPRHKWKPVPSVGTRELSVLPGV